MLNGKITYQHNLAMYTYLKNVNANQGQRWNGNA